MTQYTREFQWDVVINKWREVGGAISCIECAVLQSVPTPAKDRPPVTSWLREHHRCSVTLPPDSSTRQPRKVLLLLLLLLFFLFSSVQFPLCWCKQDSMRFLLFQSEVLSGRRDTCLTAMTILANGQL